MGEIRTRKESNQMALQTQYETTMVKVLIGIICIGDPVPMNLSVESSEAKQIDMGSCPSTRTPTPDSHRIMMLVILMGSFNGKDSLTGITY